MLITSIALAILRRKPFSEASKHAAKLIRNAQSAFTDEVSKLIGGQDVCNYLTDLRSVDAAVALLLEPKRRPISAGWAARIMRRRTYTSVVRGLHRVL